MQEEDNNNIGGIFQDKGEYFRFTTSLEGNLPIDSIVTVTTVTEATPYLSNNIHPSLGQTRLASGIASAGIKSDININNDFLPPPPPPPPPLPLASSSANNNSISSVGNLLSAAALVGGLPEIKRRRRKRKINSYDENDDGEEEEKAVPVNNPPPQPRKRQVAAGNHNNNNSIPLSSVVVAHTATTSSSANSLSNGGGGYNPLLLSFAGSPLTILPDERGYYEFQFLNVERLNQLEEKLISSKDAPQEELEIISQEKQALLAQGFPTWSEADFRMFLLSLATNGRANVKDIVIDLSVPPYNKTKQDVERYLAVFFEKGPTQMKDWGKIAKNIKKKDGKLEASKLEEIGKKIAQYKEPLYDLDFLPAIRANRSGAYFSMEEDRFLIMLAGEKNALNDMYKLPTVFFDHFLHSLNEDEIDQRSIFLLKLLRKESEEIAKMEAKQSRERARLEVENASLLKQEADLMNRIAELEKGQLVSNIDAFKTNRANGVDSSET